ncbi:MAG: peptidase M13, partial [Propionibacteriaceae bacterium]|nr:peptidase M13 [Propionibacteriaceae bacterium]
MDGARRRRPPRQVTGYAVPVTHFDLDGAVRPQDDLFRHVNGKWLARAEIAPDRASAGVFTKLTDDSESAIREIVTSLSGSPEGSEARKVEDLFAAFMDEERISAVGLAPLAAVYAEIDAIGSVLELLEYFGRSLRRGTGAPLSLDVEADPADPSRYSLFAEQSGIGLPDEEYYRLEQHAPILAEYRAHVERMRKLAPWPEDGDVVALEAEIAGHHWDKISTRDMVKMYNPMSVADFSKDGVDWGIVMRAADIPDPGVIINSMPSFFTGLAGMLTAERLGEWKAWLKWAALSSLAPYLTESVVNEQFAFYGTTLSGTPKLKERWKRGVALVEETLGEAVGKLYVAKHFPPAAKARMDKLVANLIEAYRVSISKLEWMGDQTRAQALDKLAKFTAKIGYPDIWFDYAKLRIDPADLAGNVLRAGEFFFDDEISKIGKPIRKHEWLMTPQTVNAYY